MREILLKFSIRGSFVKEHQVSRRRMPGTGILRVDWRLYEL